jgi:hypothetical protein
VFPEDVADAEPGEAGTMTIPEESIAGKQLVTTFGQEAGENVGSLWPQRADAFFAPLPKQANMRRSLKTHVRHTNRDDFLNPRPRIKHRREERVITATVNGSPINSVQHRLNLIEFEVLDCTGTRTFERHRQNSLTEFQLLWMLRSTISKERVNRGEPDISRRRNTVPLGFKVLKEI